MAIGESASNPTQNVLVASTRYRRRLLLRIVENWDLYLLLIVPLVLVIVFKYQPMYGAQIAFRRFSAVQGISGSPWIGLEHFTRFFQSFNFSRILWNTISLSIYELVVDFPIPIVLALGLNYARNQRFKKAVQMITYAPRFISTVVAVGIVMQFLALRTGPVNLLIDVLGGSRVNFMGEPHLFQSIYVWSEVWQGMGWSSIIYLAALSSVDPELHEAAIVDGATKVQRIRHVDIPGILPTAVILLILRTGRILNVGFEKVLLLQNPLNVGRSEIIATYVYKVGIESAIPNFSFAAAVGLFQAIVSFVLIIAVNAAAKRMGDTSLW